MDSTTTEQLQKAGDVNIERILISSSNGIMQDITNQVIGIQIFEDIFAPFTTGILSVKDALDLLNFIPLCGEEYLDLKISTPTLGKSEINARFAITKLTDRIPLGDRAIAYDLHFISYHAIVDINKKISRVFTGKCSDIAKRILSDKTVGLQTDNVIVEETSNSTKFISNFWSPVRCLNYLTTIATNINKSASYLFYQDRYALKFMSLDNIYRDFVYQNFIYDNYVRDVNENGTSTRNIQEQYKRIRTFKQPVVYDYIDRIRSGFYASTLYSYDLTTKRVEDKTYDMLGDFQNLAHLNKNPLASQSVIYNSNSVIMTLSKYYGNFSGVADVTSYKMTQQRMSLLKQIDSNKITITVPGRLDYTVGIKIYLTIYKMEPTYKDDTDVIDKMLSGIYIIAAINHYINRNEHECTMEIVKESLLRNLDENG